MTKRKTVFELLPPPKKYSIRNLIRIWHGASGAFAMLTPTQILRKNLFRKAFLVDVIIIAAGLAKKILKINPPHYHLENLPFGMSDFVFKGLIGLRLEKDVYLFESVKKDSPSFVLKVVDRLSDENKRKSDAWKTIIEQTYARMKDIYTKIPSFIPDYEIVILKNPSCSREYCVAIKQVYQEGDLLDIFMEIEEARLIELMQKHPNLARRIELFVQCTVDHFEKTGEMVDINSKGNVVIKIRHGEEPSLVFIDDGLKYRGDKKNPKNLAAFKKLDRLSQLRKKIA